jgi:hypothetical protein
MPVQDTMIALVANTYVNHLLDAKMRAREFELLGRLAGSIPVRQVRPHADPPYLTRLCEVIVEDFQALTSPGDALRAGRQS